MSRRQHLFIVPEEASALLKEAESVTAPESIQERLRSLECEVAALTHEGDLMEEVINEQGEKLAVMTKTEKEIRRKAFQEVQDIVDRVADPNQLRAKIQELITSNDRMDPEDTGDTSHFFFFSTEQSSAAD